MLATEERMQDGTSPQKRSEEQGSRIPERPAQQSATLGFAAASIIERAAKRLDWTIAFGVRHSTPHSPEEITNDDLGGLPGLRGLRDWGPGAPGDSGSG